MRLDIESLRALKIVSEAGGVTRAAERLRLTQSAVSHKIKRLEERIGRPLFRRGENGILPTADGRELLGYAERLLALHDEAVARLGGSNLAGSLRLGITEDTTAAGIARVMARFATSHPKVSLAAKVSQSLTLFEWLRDGRIDLAVAQIFEHEVLPQDRVLWRDDLLWVQSEDVDFQTRDPIPFIAFDENCFYRRWALAATAERHPALKVVLDCPSIAGVRSAVRSGLGVSIINRRNMEPGLRPADFLSRPLPPIAYVARTAARPTSAPLSALLAAITEELGQLR